MINERSRKQLSAISIIDGLFEENLSNSLNDASLNLAFDEDRLKEVSTIVNCCVRDYFDNPGFRFDLNFGNVTAIWKCLRHIDRKSSPAFRKDRFRPMWPLVWQPQRETLFGLCLERRNSRRDIRYRSTRFQAFPPRL